ncbi:MAG: hypothetical protein J6Y02_17275 [Pseudobutyrivibrio sp.]|nr:hypothetical protein [Pseudobutyrivibrio sp.]
MTYLSTKDGYAIEPKLKQNRIIIYLPQTTTTMMSTMYPTGDRKDELSEAELASILGLVVSICKGGYNASKE